MRTLISLSAIHFCNPYSIGFNREAIDNVVNGFSPSEHKRYLTLSDSRQIEFAVSRLLLRNALSQHTGAPISDWVLEERSSNTPIVLNESWQGFISITHSKNFVACAVSDRAVGVDVEEPRAVPNLKKMAARVFTPEQQNRLRDNHHRERLFLQMWTEKEALYKAHSSAGEPIQFMSTAQLDDIGIRTSNIFTQRLYGALASSLPFDQFSVYFWRSPQQVRQIRVKPNR